MSNKVRINKLSYADGKNHEVLCHEEDSKGKPQIAHLESDNKESFATDRPAVSQPASNPCASVLSLYRFIVSLCENSCFCISLKNMDSALMISAFPSKFLMLSK